MNTKKVCLQGLLGGLLVTMALGPLALPAMAEGVIQFAQKFVNGEPGGEQCFLSLQKPGQPYRVYRFEISDVKCENDKYLYFRFVDVPSSTVVAFDSSRYCDGKQWRMTVRTTKNPTTSPWKAIYDIRTTEKNKPVVAGIMKLDDNNKDGAEKESLSCMEIYPAEL